MNPLCLAIDTRSATVAHALARSTGDYVGVFKIGATTFAALGPQFVTDLASQKPVFCDLKLHDIPSQVEGAVAAIAGLGASFATVHSLGGRDMVRAAARGASNELKILGVTILTSLSGEDLEELGIKGTPLEAVVRLAENALEAGAGGLVCSGSEVRMLRERFGAASSGGPLLVVPGIRLDSRPSSDQQRTFRPGDALEAGADLVVVGRPITGAQDPAAAAQSILEHLTA
jgi:orotidine-5'-phosphate decarboxylase